MSTLLIKMGPSVLFRTFQITYFHPSSLILVVDNSTTRGDKFFVPSPLTENTDLKLLKNDKYECVLFHSPRTLTVVRCRVFQRNRASSPEVVTVLNRTDISSIAAELFEALDAVCFAASIYDAGESSFFSEYRTYSACYSLDINGTEIARREATSRSINNNFGPVIASLHLNAEQGLLSASYESTSFLLVDDFNARGEVHVISLDPARRLLSTEPDVKLIFTADDEHGIVRFVFVLSVTNKLPNNRN